eukprot:4877897-Amphidinium_carterae.1
MWTTIPQLSLQLLDLLGWKFAREGGKYHGFEPGFKALGINIVMSADGLIVGNTSSRLGSINSMCASLLAAPRWSRRSIDTLVGRCNFARSFMEGRPLHLALATLWDLLARSGGNRTVHRHQLEGL